MNCKKSPFLFFVLLLSISIKLNAQNGVGVRTTNPKSSLDINGSFAKKVTVVTTSTTLNDTLNTIVCNNGGTAINITLPTASTCSGRIYQIKKNATSTANVTLVATIDGGTNLVMSQAKQAVSVFSDGTEWKTISGGASSNATSWDLLGNAGTVDGTHFIGTTDGVPLSFRVANQRAGRIDHYLNNTFLGVSSGTNSMGGDSNTGIGASSLANNSDGVGNTATGAYSLQLNIDGSYNTGFGVGTLSNNDYASYNTAVGGYALSNNYGGDENTAVGYFALGSNETGLFNTAVGSSALGGNIDGQENTAVGYYALGSVQSAIYNTAVGSQALASNINAEQNTAIGYQALYSNDGGEMNTAIGSQALFNNTAGYNTAVGQAALYFNTIGDANVALGNNSLFSNTEGRENVALGSSALYSNTLGSQNTATGSASLLYNTTGDGNTAYGQLALFSNNSGSSNTANGVASLYSNTAGNNNCAMGVSALQNTTGSNNTAIGSFAGSSITTGSSNIAIGSSAQVPTATASNQLSIGNWIYGVSGRIGIGTNAPNASALLDVTSTSKGVLLPRVTLTATSDVTTISSPATGLMVYNTATAGVSPNNVIPGFYYYNGSAWVRMATSGGTSGNAWQTTGNAGTTAGTHFIGTTDAVDLVLSTNSSERMRVLSTGNVGIGTTNPPKKLYVAGGHIGLDNAQWITFKNPAGSNDDGVINYDASSNLTLNRNNDIYLKYGGATQATLLANGNMGIGTTSPTVKLQLEGSATNGSVGTEEIFKMGRALTVASSFQQVASFKLGRWAVPSGIYESFTRLDIALKGNASVSDYNADVTVMTLQNNGNVGIGTTSPADLLHVYGSSATPIRWERSTGSKQWALGVNNSFSYIHNITDNVVPITFLNGGNVGVGTTTPGAISSTTGSSTAKFEVAGNMRMNGQSSATSGELDALQFLKCHASGCGITTYSEGEIRSYTSNGYAGGLRIYSSIHTGGGNYGLTPAITIGSTPSDITVANVGIGTTTPSNKLDVAVTDANTAHNLVAMPLKLSNTSNTAGAFTGIQFNGVTNTAVSYPAGSLSYDYTPGAGILNSNFHLRIVNAGNYTEVLTALNSGNIGIGTATPISKLHLEDGNYLQRKTTDADNIFTMRNTVANRSWNLYHLASTDASAPNGFLFEYYDGSTYNRRLTINQNGNIGIGTPTPGGQLELSLDQGRKPSTNTWTITSDERLKTIDGAYTKGLKEILKLQPITYRYKNVGERKFANEVLKTTNIGFSAQEVQKIFPEAVGTDTDGYLNFNMHAILVAYVNAIKEQEEKIGKQEITISKLQEENSVIKSDYKNLKAELESIKALLVKDNNSSKK